METEMSKKILLLAFVAGYAVGQYWPLPLKAQEAPKNSSADVTWGNVEGLGCALALGALSRGPAWGDDDPVLIEGTWDVLLYEKDGEKHWMRVTVTRGGHDVTPDVALTCPMGEL